MKTKINDLEHLRVLQVVNIRWFNATAWYALFLSRLLKEAGHDVLVLGLSNTPVMEKAKEWGVPFHSLSLNTANPFKLISLYKNLKKELSSFNPNIVNCHRGENYFLWPLLRFKFPYALVRTRGDQRTPKSYFFNGIIHNKLTDGLIATNSATAYEFNHLLNSPESHISIIQGGVDSKKFRYNPLGRMSVRSEFGFTENDFVLGFLGRFDPVKGILELLNSVGSLVKSEPVTFNNLKLLLVGFPANISQETIDNYIVENALEGRVFITGKRDDVPSCISAFDAGIIASQGSEAIARAAFEIMSCGVPLIGTRIGVMPDLLPEDALVPAADHDALSGIIAKVVTKSSWRNDLRERELQIINAFSEQEFLQQTLIAYKRALYNRFK